MLAYFVEQLFGVVLGLECQYPELLLGPVSELLVLGVEFGECFVGGGEMDFEFLMVLVGERKVVEPLVDHLPLFVEDELIELDGLFELIFLEEQLVVLVSQVLCQLGGLLEIYLEAVDLVLEVEPFLLQ